MDSRSASEERAIIVPTKDSGEDDVRIGIVWKLILCAQLCGIEASNAFEQLYTVPLLQTLGMPLRLASLVALMEGPVAMVMLPMIGWLTDRGSNTQRRKTIAVYFGAGLLICGMTCVITANIMHLEYMLNFDFDVNAPNTTDHADGIPDNGSVSWNQSTVATAVFSSSTQNAAFYESFDAEATTHSNTNDGVLEYSSKVPFKAGLGMLGCFVLSLGFDTMNSAVRPFLLMCSPRAEHTSVLVLGLIMASLGGLSTAALGIVDFTELFGLSSSLEGGSLAIQTGLQGVLVSGLVLVGLLVTTLSGYRQRRLIMQRQASLPDNDDLTGALGDIHPASQPSQDDPNRRNIVDIFESSIRSFAGAGVHFDYTPGLLSQSQDFTFRKRQSSLSSERAHLLSQEHDMSVDSGEFGQSHTTSMSLSYGSKGAPSYLSSEQTHQTTSTTPLQDVPENAMLKTERPAAESSSQCCHRGFKTKIALIVLATYVGGGAMIMFSFTGSDFVAKAIYGGEPDAPPGSLSLARYQEGMQAASWGFLVHYGTYLCFSFVHPRVLAKLGCRLEFVLVHLLFGMAMLLVSVTLRLEAFYFLSVVAAFDRACYYMVPFSITNDVINDRISSTGGKANTGLAMSLVSASLPVAYCSLFPWVGPVEEFTGNVVIPMWLGAGFCFLASLVMVMLGKV